VARGTVSDQTIEPVLSSDPITAAQRRCVEAALSQPSYRIVRPDTRSTLPKVSLVIEF